MDTRGGALEARAGDRAASAYVEVMAVNEQSRGANQADGKTRRARVTAEALSAYVAELMPGAVVKSVRGLGPDAHPEGETEKAIGYGRLLRLEVVAEDGTRQDLVVHFAIADEHGHDRRADRVAAQILAFDTFPRVPDHVQAVDVGMVGPSGELVSLRETGEPYLVTRWVDGELYADDLRRVARDGELGELDLARATTLARYLKELHQAPGSHPEAYVRALRDLVGSGEGIAGIADGYPEGTPGASRERIEAIEGACLAHRHRLREKTDRLRRTHGDFHPWNLVFDGTKLSPLDAARGCEGDPADDVAALTINYLFFGVAHRDRWASGLGQLWDRFFEAYDDSSIELSIAPFFAWRGLVVASPRWYPHLAAGDRDRILTFVERVLDAPRFDPAMGREALA